MFKISYHDNGKFESLEINWKIIVALTYAFSTIISEFFSMLAKAFLIIVIAIQGLFADPDSFKARFNYRFA